MLEASHQDYKLTATNHRKQWALYLITQAKQAEYCSSLLAFYIFHVLINGFGAEVLVSWILGGTG